MRNIIILIVLFLITINIVIGASLRGSQQELNYDSPIQQQEGPLVSFMQQHQRAYASQSSSSLNSSPSQEAKQAAEQTVPLGASEASAENVLSALEKAPHHKQHHSLVQTHSTHSSTTNVAVSGKSFAKGPGEDGDGEDFGPCKTCVFVLERIKKGSNMLLPAICSELYHKYPDAYALCHQVLNALSINGNNVRYWLFEGCFKYEIYQSKEWIKPCPSHVMCSVLKDLSAEPFCPALPMENPFAEGGSDAGGE